MPATAGRVRMPANNRVHSSAALQTHGIWQSAIGYDPYAPTNAGSDKGSARPGEDSAAAAAAENAYSSFQGLLALARATGSVSNDARGACKKCGRVGHLAFQCRNFLSTKDPSAAEKEKGDEALQAAATAAFEQIRKSNGLKDESSEEEEEEEEKESDSSDSDVDPEIEKIIAARFGKKSKKSTDDKRAEDSKEDKVSHQHRGRSKKRSGRKRSKESDESDSGKEDDKRKKRRHRGFDDDVDEDKHGHRHSRSRRDEKRRKNHKKRDESDDYDDDSEDESVRRHHHKRRHYQRNDSESDSDDSDRTNSRKKSHKHHDRHGKKRTTTTSECGAENDGSENVRGRKGRK